MSVDLISLAPSFPLLTAASFLTTPFPSFLCSKERQLEELRQKDRSYQREVSKLEKRVAEAEAQAVALESYAPPPEVDPIALLQEIRRKAELLLGERNAVLGLPEEGGGYHGPLSEEVEEEASRWVSRKLLGQL